MRDLEALFMCLLVPVSWIVFLYTIDIIRERREERALRGPSKETEDEL